MADSQPKPHRWTEVLRWLAVLPAAMIAWWISGGVLSFLPSLVGLDLRGTVYPTFLFPLLFYLGSGVAFTLVGGLIAPAKRIATSMTLAILCILMSVQVHIMGQSNPGLTNYMHSTGEALGAVIGVGVLYRVRRSRQQTAKELEDDH